MDYESVNIFIKYFFINDKDDVSFLLLRALEFEPFYKVGPVEIRKYNIDRENLYLFILNND